MPVGETDECYVQSIEIFFTCNHGRTGITAVMSGKGAACQ